MTHVLIFQKHLVPAPRCELADAATPVVDFHSWKRAPSFELLPFSHVCSDHTFRKEKSRGKDGLDFPFRQIHSNELVSDAVDFVVRYSVKCMH